VSSIYHNEFYECLFEDVMGLIGPYEQAATAKKVDEVRNYCRMFTEVAECFLYSQDDRSNQGFGDLRIVDIVLACLECPDFRVAEISFPFI